MTKNDPSAPTTWDTIEAFGSTYQTNPSLQFGDYDSSTHEERSNVLWCLREATGLWSGEIAYDYKLDRVVPEGLDDTEKRTVWWRTHHVIYTGINPVERTEIMVGTAGWPTRTGSQPKAILYTHGQGTVLFMREDILEELELDHATASEVGAYCSDTEEEVRILMQDGAWNQTIHTDLERELVHLWDHDRQAHRVLCPTYVAHDTTTRTGVCLISKADLHKRLQCYLDATGTPPFENTAWAIDLKAAAEHIVQQIMEEKKKPPGERAN